MGLKSWCRRHENQLLASLLLLALLLFAGIRYDYYFDLNDDVMMKDTLSGVYTGVPEGHNIQMLYPLSFLLSLLYRIFPKASVYGFFLCLCQYGSIWLAAERSLRYGKNIWRKAAMALAEGTAVLLLLLPHLVFVQYTFVSAMLAGTAAFLFMTSPAEEKGHFVRRNILPVLLAVLAYMLRTEMLLLLLPLICVAGMYRWSLEERVFAPGNAKAYLTVFGGILAGMLAAWGIHACAFGSPEWKEYVAFFNSRTELYDFQGIPSYEGNEELYRSLGMTESGQEMLLEQYNFGLDDTLCAEDLDRISEYQRARKGEKQDFFGLFAEKLKLYKYRSFHKEPAGSAAADDYPWNFLAIAGYGAVFLAAAAGAVRRRDYRSAAAGAGKLFFLFSVRTSLWMFILIKGRDPVRITHSLYWMELCILSAMFLAETAGGTGISRDNNRQASFRGASAPAGLTRLAGRNLQEGAGAVCSALLLAAVIFAGGMAGRECVAETDKEYAARMGANAVDKGMKEYSRSHPDCFYFIDVYSSVSYPSEPYFSVWYSEKIFADVDNSLGNYDIMGGWLVKSPTHRKKLEAFGLASMEEALLYRENVYMMAELQKGTEAFERYFEERGRDVEPELEDTVAGIIGVYKLEVTGG